VKFSSDAETLAAMVVTTQWLPELVRRIETGVEARGAKIEKKAMLRFGDDTVCPVLFLRGKRGWQLEFRLRNALEDFLLLDRDERPVRLDPRLLDAEFAAGKLADVVSARLAMVRALNESRDADDVAGNIQKLAGKHGTFRIWRYGDGARDGRPGG
jgi:hypothetical protein